MALYGTVPHLFYPETPIDYSSPVFHLRVASKGYSQPVVNTIVTTGPSFGMNCIHGPAIGDCSEMPLFFAMAMG